MWPPAQAVNSPQDLSSPVLLKLYFNLLWLFVWAYKCQKKPFLLIWACGSSSTLHSLADLFFHSRTMVFESNKWSVIGKIDINTYNQCMIVTIIASPNGFLLGYSLILIRGHVSSGVFCESIVGIAGSWHWEPRKFSIQLWIASNSTRPPAYLFPLRLTEMGAVNSSNLLCTRMTMP